VRIVWWRNLEGLLVLCSLRVVVKHWRCAGKHQRRIRSSANSQIRETRCAVFVATAVSAQEAQNQICESVSWNSFIAFNIHLAFGISATSRTRKHVHTEPESLISIIAHVKLLLFASAVDLYDIGIMQDGRGEGRFLLPAA
jgi:hypothetical protein